MNECVASRRGPLRAVGSVVALIAALAGCGSDFNDVPGGAVPAVDVDAPGGASEYSFSTTVSEFSAGPVRLSLTNNGTEEHQIALLKLNSDVSAEQFQVTVKNDDNSSETLFSTILSSGKLVGGPNVVSPGGATQSSVMTLDSGEYVMICLIPAADGVPHALKGMIRPVHVTDPANHRSLATPTADISLQDFGFGFGGAGAYAVGQRVEVANNGTQNHELAMYRLDRGQTAEQYIQAGLPADQVTASGGVSPTAPGTTAQITLPTQPGNYLFICFLPDTAGKGALHFTLGMYAQVTIGSG
jgi:uncharacterized cupredoxin-like copper-binding protein